MTTAVESRFRLLDGYVGWDPLSDCGLAGVHDETGLRLFSENEPRISSDDLSALIPPAWLVRGCQPCEWYLVAGDKPASVMRKDPCSGCWIDILPTLAAGEGLRRPLAVTTRGSRLAVSGYNEMNWPAVFVWSIPDRRLISLATPESVDDEFDPGPLVFAPWGELIVAHKTEARLFRLTPTGDLLGETSFAAPQPVRRLAVGKDGAVWAATGEELGPFELWRFELAAPVAQERAGRRMAPACCEFPKLAVEQVDDLHLRENRERVKRNFRETGLVTVSEAGFCLQQPGADGPPVTHCFRRDGVLAVQSDIVSAPEPNTLRFGQLLTKALDSGIPRCEWHRVRVEADVPQQTRLSIAVATSEDGPQRDAEQTSASRPRTFESDDEFADGVPNRLDWQEVDNPTDFLIQQPRGRYLHVRLRLSSENDSTPLVRRVRIDFPRVTSLQQLPAVYREDPTAEDFTQRFLSLFDASTEAMDDVVDRFATLLDPDGVPQEVLPWIASFLGIVFNPSWEPDRRRQLLLAAPALYRQRGTAAGLRQAVELIFGVTPAIEERAMGRAWGVLKQDARVGSMRLFGRSRARFRIGSSALGEVPILSFGNPEHDPFRSEAYRFTVLAPEAGLGPQELARLDALIASQKPAHTAHRLRVGGGSLVVGSSSVVGIDTTLRLPPAPVLGGRARRLTGSTRLSDRSILRYGPLGRATGMRVGRTIVGVNTLVE